MSSSFDSFAGFAAELALMQVETYHHLHEGLVEIAEKIEGVAKSEFGHYQPAIGGFAAWSQLADATMEDRVRKGFDADAPLLRTGGLRDSIEHTVDGLEAAVGSNSDIMVWQEMGTERIPPRAVLGPALERNKEAVKQIVGDAIMGRFVGGSKE